LAFALAKDLRYFNRGVNYCNKAHSAVKEAVYAANKGSESI